MKAFADEHGITFPMINAPLNRFERDGGWPTYVLLGPGHELLMVDEGEPTDAQIQQYIDEFFPE